MTDLKEAFTMLEKQAHKMDFEIHENETKYLKAGKNQRRTEYNIL